MTVIDSTTQINDKICNRLILSIIQLFHPNNNDVLSSAEKKLSVSSVSLVSPIRSLSSVSSVILVISISSINYKVFFLLFAQLQTDQLYLATFLVEVSMVRSLPEDGSTSYKSKNSISSENKSC